MTDEQVDGPEGEWHDLALAACVLVAEQATAAGFDLAAPGYWSRRFGPIELALEPLTFGRFDLAVYSGRVLLLPRKLRVTLE